MWQQIARCSRWPWGRGGGAATTRYRTAASATSFPFDDSHSSFLPLPQDGPGSDIPRLAGPSWPRWVSVYGTGNARTAVVDGGESSNADNIEIAHEHRVHLMGRRPARRREHIGREQRRLIWVPAVRVFLVVTAPGSMINDQDSDSPRPFACSTGRPFQLVIQTHAQEHLVA